jgi:hypothetical protein
MMMPSKHIAPARGEPTNECARTRRQPTWLSIALRLHVQLRHCSSPGGSQQTSTQEIENSFLIHICLKLKKCTCYQDENAFFRFFCPRFLFKIPKLRMQISENLPNRPEFFVMIPMVHATLTQQPRLREREYQFVTPILTQS